LVDVVFGPWDNVKENLERRQRAENNGWYRSHLNPELELLPNS